MADSVKTLRSIAISVVKVDESPFGGGIPRVMLKTEFKDDKGADIYPPRTESLIGNGTLTFTFNPTDP